MFRLKPTRVAIAAAAVFGMGVVLVAGQVARANDDPPAQAGTPADPTGAATFLAAVLDGRNEVPVVGGPAANDPDGQAIEILRIKGNQVSFAVQWKNLSAFAAGHIHAGT